MEENSAPLEINPMEVIEEIKGMQNGQMMLDLAVQRIVSKKQNEMIQQLQQQLQPQEATGEGEPAPVSDIEARAARAKPKGKPAKR
jgi:hypothetical protein